MEAFKNHYKKSVTQFFILKSYIDDVFGGTRSKAQGVKLIKLLILVGKLTTAVMNPLKCEGPAQVLDVLGLRYSAVLRRVTITEAKRGKYLSKLRVVLSSFGVTSSDLGQLLGYRRS